LPSVLSRAECTILIVDHFHCADPEELGFDLWIINIPRKEIWLWVWRILSALTIGSPFSRWFEALISFDP